MDINYEVANLQNRIMTQRFEGDAPASFISAMTAQLSRPIMNKLQLAQSQLQADQQQFKMTHDMAIEQFDANKSQAAIDTQDRRILEDRKYGLEDAFRNKAFADDTNDKNFAQDTQKMDIMNKNDLAKMNLSNKFDLAKMNLSNKFDID